MPVQALANQTACLCVRGGRFMCLFVGRVSDTPTGKLQRTPPCGCCDSGYGWLTIYTPVTYVAKLEGHLFSYYINLTRSLLKFRKGCKSSFFQSPIIGMFNVMFYRISLAMLKNISAHITGQHILLFLIILTNI